MYGKAYMGIARSTFVIDAGGTIVKVFTAVKPEGHDREVLASLATLSKR
jgi:peroxiredoxin Q/BCP